MEMQRDKSFKTWGITAMFCLMMGCATEHVTTTGKQYPPTSAAKIAIYYTQRPKKPYVEVGRVGVDKYNNLAISRSGEEIDRLLKEKAASIGGDAVVFITEDFASVSGIVIRNK
jgi:hypothetical protein